MNIVRIQSFKGFTWAFFIFSRKFIDTLPFVDNRVGISNSKNAIQRNYYELWFIRGTINVLFNKTESVDFCGKSPTKLKQQITLDISTEDVQRLDHSRNDVSYSYNNFVCGEISPTRCNNCVFYSQWLYSTCFG